MFSKILIANRGEIAVRIIRACREMGIATVAVYSEADKDALHVSLADESICIGKAAASESYLNMTAILSAATMTGASAIHPGYGLLSENAKFAELCAQCGITFIGPSYEVIGKMGDKEKARQTMQAAGVPVIPGSDAFTDRKKAAKRAVEIGFPLMIKARSGGGGKGIRLVREEKDFNSAFDVAAREAEAAFGDGALYLEKYVNPAAHIEMQIMADKSGNVICMGERQCSIQLNNQKLLEESPAPTMSAEKRKEMMEASVKAAKACGYENAGTIEYLVDKEGNFYFMEMNTRLQVEHTVTEMITGKDLVKWQIRIAAGVDMDFTQDDIRLDGCAIECRINTRSAGRIKTLHIPGGPNVRFDTALYQDYTVPPYYDSMVGKLIVKAGTREEAIRKMNAALCELIVEGLSVNIEQQLDILTDERFIEGAYDTGFMEKYQK